MAIIPDCAFIKNSDYAQLSTNDQDSALIEMINYLIGEKAFIELKELAKNDPKVEQLLKQMGDQKND